MRAYSLYLKLGKILPTINSEFVFVRIYIVPFESYLDLTLSHCIP